MIPRDRDVTAAREVGNARAAGGGEGREGAGEAVPTTYTRSRMETGILGAPRRLQPDVVSGEAQAAIATAADRLRALGDELHAAYEAGTTAPSPADATDTVDATAAPTAGEDLLPARDLIGRLEHARRELSAVADTLVAAGPGPASGGTGARSSDARTARAVLSGQEQERVRLAEELHDGPAQALANVIFQTEIVSRTVGDNPPAQAELGDLRRLVQRELDSLRAYISQLRPSLREEQGFEEALRESAAQLTESSGVAVDVDIAAGGEELDEASRGVALRVAQEALRNVAKHASATRAWLRTSRSDGNEAHPAAWVLEVGDDGRGFDAGEAQAHTDRRHFGLRFMRERAELLGARLAIETGPAVGTIVRLIINTGGERSKG